MLLASSLPRPSDADADAARHVARLLNLAFAVLVLLANGPLTLAALAPAARAGLCTPDEAAVLAAVADPLAVAVGWALTLLARLCHDRRALPEPTLQYLQAQAVELRGHASEALLYTQTQLPYAAVQLSSAVVFAFIAQAAPGRGGETGERESAHPRPQTHAHAHSAQRRRHRILPPPPTEYRTAG